MSLIISLLVGGIAGWLAGKIMNSEGSVPRNVILGLVGGVIGDVLLGIFGISGHGFVGNIIVSVVGACVLIWLSRVISR